MLAVLNNANLPRLTTLNIRETSIGDDPYAQEINWTDFMVKMDLNTLEELTIYHCEDFDATAAFQIAEAAPTFPQLKKYNIIPLWETESALSTREARNFFCGPRAARLESLQLRWVRCSGEEMEVFALECAANIPLLRSLVIHVSYINDVQLIAEAGKNGFLPRLEKLVLRIGGVCEDMYFSPSYDDDYIDEMSGELVPEEYRLLYSLADPQQYCKDVLEPVFGPGLDLRVVVSYIMYNPEDFW